MPYAKRTEKRIKDARRAGKFDRLTGRGMRVRLGKDPRTRELPKNVDQMIAEAMKRGDFDDLPGKGKPLDLDGYFKTPPHLRMAYHILKTAGYLPPEVELKKEIERLKERRDATQDEKERSRLDRVINEKRAAYDLAVEKNRSSG